MCTTAVSMLFISHDLGVVRHVSHRVAVMQAGRIVETGPVDIVLATPTAPYTRTLLASAVALPGPDRADAPSSDRVGTSPQAEPPLVLRPTQ